MHDFDLDDEIYFVMITTYFIVYDIMFESLMSKLKCVILIDHHWVVLFIHVMFVYYDCNDI